MPAPSAPDAPRLMLAQYQKIADITAGMRDAARQDDWDQVLALSKQYSQAVETLQRYDQDAASMSAQERSAKRDLLMRILADDASTRELIAPQLAWLSSLLGQLKRQKSLLHTYGRLGLLDSQASAP